MDRCRAGYSACSIQCMRVFLPMGMAIFGPLADRIPLEWIMTFFR